MQKTPHILRFHLHEFLGAGETNYGKKNQDFAVDGCWSYRIG